MLFFYFCYFYCFFFFFWLAATGHNRCCFSYAGTWELVNLSVGTKNVIYHICYENIRRKTTKWKYSEVKRQTDHGQTELSNMPVKKNVLNETNKEVTFTQGFKDCRKIKKNVSQNLDDLQNLLIKVSVKASAQRKRGYFTSFNLV